ncbi:hypothetical protein BDR04DRAFT_1160882 [Suillus decipiens]|nr:hypothetical protein BDR04DRAFT_1160882 [Suillus decipiens]
MPQVCLDAFKHYDNAFPGLDNLDMHTGQDDSDGYAGQDDTSTELQNLEDSQGHDRDENVPPHEPEEEEIQGGTNDAEPRTDHTVGLNDADLAELSRFSRLNDIKDAMIFIQALCSAMLDDGVINIELDALERLRNPPQEILSINDPDVLLLLKLFLADTTEAAYNSICSAIMEHFPDSEVLSHYQICC